MKLAEPAGKRGDRVRNVHSNRTATVERVSANTTFVIYDDEPGVEYGGTHSAFEPLSPK